jgi:hypothetical protein
LTLVVDDIREICNLPDEELEARRARANQELFAFVKHRQERPTGLALVFDETPELRERLDAFVAAERVCCVDIDWSVRSDSGSLRLEIAGIDPRSPAFADLGSTLALQPEPGEPIVGPRLLRAVGLGSLGALLLCCALPLAVAAVVGTTSLLLLDNPWVIAGSALVFGGSLWYWEGRRKARRSKVASISGCGC